MASEQFEVFPEKDGSWNWQLRAESGKVADSGSGYESRGEALQAAREARGDKVTPLFHGNGSPAGESVTRGPQRLVLLRLDGSLHGEIDHEVKPGGPPQFISISPANEHSEAVSL